MKALCLLTFLILLPAAPALAEIDGIVVVRHAEKADDGTRDPALTQEGRSRARALADALDQAKIGGLIASQYRRTQQTLAVLAEQRGLDVTVIAAASGDIGAHVDAVAEAVFEPDASGIMVIAGHSNTVPLIVEALSGKRIAPIGEGEYDQLFILLPADSGMNVIETRYGKSSKKPGR